jgi:hypothetical protein
MSPLLNAIWEWNPLAICAVPPPIDEDWVRLRGRDARTSALWEALCEIIAPRRWYHRGGNVSMRALETLRALIRRRPGGANATLHGCMHVFHTSDAILTVGSPKKTMHPLSAVLYLARVLCELQVDRPDFYQSRRAAACTRVLLDMGARTDALYPYALCKAFKDRRCHRSLAVLLQHGRLCAAIPRVCLAVYERTRDPTLGAALKKEAHRHNELALAWMMLAHPRLAGRFHLSSDLLRMIAEYALVLLGL